MYIKSGVADYKDIVTSGEHTAAITEVQTAINNTNLYELAYVQYAAITNTATTAVDTTHHFYAKQGESYTDIGNNSSDLDDNFYVFKDGEYNEETGKYMFNGEDVGYENIYKL